MSNERTVQATIRATTGGDVPALKVVIDAVDLIPAEVLEEIMAPFLAGATQAKRWLTADVDGAPVAVASSPCIRIANAAGSGRL